MRVTLNEQLLLARVMKNTNLPQTDIRNLSERELEITLASAKLDKLANKVWKYWHGEDTSA